MCCSNGLPADWPCYHRNRRVWPCPLCVAAGFKFACIASEEFIPLSVGKYSLVKVNGAHAWHRHERIWLNSIQSMSNVKVFATQDGWPAGWTTAGWLDETDWSHRSISRVSNQNGLSLQWYIVEIHHSGQKPLICYSYRKKKMQHRHTWMNTMISYHVYTAWNHCIIACTNFSQQRTAHLLRTSEFAILTAHSQSCSQDNSFRVPIT